MGDTNILENIGVVFKTNKSGGAHVLGDVCVEDPANANSVINTTTEGYTDGAVWVCLETVADDAVGKYAVAIKAPQINLDGSASLGDLIKTSSTPKLGTPHAPPMEAGDFAAVMGTGTSPAASLFGAPKTSSGGGGNHAYFAYLAASLEPLAIEPLQVDGFSYAVAGGDTKLLLASWNTKLGSTGRMEIRDPSRFMSLRGVTLAGLGAGAAAALIDPTLPTYADARETYYDRLQSICEMAVKQIDVVSPATYYPFLLGAYGGIMVRCVNFEFDYIAVMNKNGVNNFNLANEINDGASAAQRNDNALTLALSKYIAAELYAGAERSGGVGEGTVAYILCPASWGEVADGTSYDFRDDFMGASLDTGSDWTRAQSSAGNVEIVTLYQWLKMVGTSTWGQNGAYSQTGISRANGKIFLIDIYTGRNATTVNSHMVGFSDGTGHDYVDFAHGVLFTSSGAANILKIYENGNDRGTVGSGYDNGTIYRVRITLGASNDCVYQIQGGSYGALGSASWTTLTPSANSSSTTPLYAGVSIGQTGTMYASDAKIY